MEQYELIKTEIDKILNSNEVTYDGTYISAYELKNIISDELKNLYQIFDNETNIVKSINKKNLISKLFNTQNLPKLDYICFETKEKGHQEMDFVFKERNNYTKVIRINKMPKNDNLFFNYDKITEKERNFVMKNIIYIINTFNIIEYYYENFEINIAPNYIKSDINQDFEYSILNISYKFQNSPKIIISLSNKELNKTFNTDWLSRENLKNYTYKNINELLKRIPIKVEELNNSYQKIVNKTLNNNKTKQLKK